MNQGRNRSVLVAQKAAMVLASMLASGAHISRHMSHWFSHTFERAGLKQAAHGKRSSASHHNSGSLNWFSMHSREWSHEGPRSADTYRGARRNAARAAGWPERRAA